MPLSTQTKKVVFITLAIFAAITAIYHVVGIVSKVNDSPAWRHSIFAGINLFCIYGFLKRPRYFVYFFFVLMVQQFFSHGRDILTAWAQGKWDWISIAVLIVFPIAFGFLVIDAKEKAAMQNSISIN